MSSILTNPSRKGGGDGCRSTGCLVCPERREGAVKTLPLPNGRPEPCPACSSVQVGSLSVKEEQACCIGPQEGAMDVAVLAGA